ncbi:MAG: single-stranded DNA-binding protein [Capnocytophaga sp.]|nr:single-stranded DNA-binding protein [Capnocytophaga sp.]
MNGSVNKVILIGRLGDNIKLTYFDKGSCVGKVRLATDESFTNKATNERIENTEWHNLVFTNKSAELIEKYTKKGDLLYIEGKLKTRQWQTQDGITRYITEIYVSDFNFLTKSNHSEKTNE